MLKASNDLSTYALITVIASIVTIVGLTILGILVFSRREI
jgi:hypothetical protein